MAENSKIEWTDDTLNPIRARNRATGKVGWHCTPASDGCRNCYAERWNRPRGTGLPYKAQALPQVEVFLDEAMLMKPMRWRKPRMVFLGSMTDIFADFVTDDMLDRIFAMMALTPQHTYQVLTKRAERMRAYACDANTPRRVARALLDLFIAGKIPDGKRTITDETWPLDDDAPDDDPRLMRWPLPNVWLGVSAEDQKTADERIPHLLATPAAVRFVSAEPLLRPIDFEPWLAWGDLTTEINGKTWGCPGCDEGCGECPEGKAHYHVTEGPKDAAGCPEWVNAERVTLDWIIVGGESGPGARPMHPDWARSIRDQCAAAGVAYFHKQNGEWAPGEIAGPNSRSIDAATWWDQRWHFERCLPARHDDHIDDEPTVFRVGKARAGRKLDGIEHNAFPAGAR